MRSFFLAGAALLALSAGTPAKAVIVFGAALGGAPDNVAGVVKQNFDGLPVNAGTPGTSPSPTVIAGQMSIAFAANSQVAQGNVSGVYAPPFLSGGNGVGFGPGGADQADGANATPYLTAFGGSSFTVTFAGDLKYLGLLWGSVDTYNTLELYLDGVLVKTITGTEVAASAAIAPNGSQSADGSVYVNIAAQGTSKFDEARFISGQPAFEVDNFAFATFVPPGGDPSEVPAPAALGLFGLGLLGLAALRRRR
jgi:hypothetical protein